MEFRRQVFVVFCLAGALMACTGSARDETPVAPVGASGAGSGVTTIPDVTPDPLQAELLADGKVSVPEMERALLAVVSCVKSRGFEAELTSFDGEGGSSFFVQDPNGDHDRASDALTECRQRFLSEVEGQFQREHGPSQREIEAEQQEVSDCLAGKGYDVKGRSYDEVTEGVDLFDLAECDPDS